MFVSVCCSTKRVDRCTSSQQDTGHKCMQEVSRSKVGVCDMELVELVWVCQCGCASVGVPVWVFEAISQLLLSIVCISVCVNVFHACTIEFM